MKIQPDFAEAHCNLGNALMIYGRADEAIDEFRMALRIKPDFAGAHQGLGNALLGRGQFDEAIAHFQKALTIRPDDGQTRSSLDVALSQRDDALKALARQRESLRSRPNDLALLNDAAWTLATNPNASLRNGAEAVELAQRAVKLSGGQDPAILATLAAAYAEAGRFSDAVQNRPQGRQPRRAAGQARPLGTSPNPASALRSENPLPRNAPFLCQSFTSALSLNRPSGTKTSWGGNADPAINRRAIVKCPYGTRIRYVVSLAFLRYFSNSGGTWSGVDVAVDLVVDHHHRRQAAGAEAAGRLPG